MADNESTGKGGGVILAFLLPPLLMFLYVFMLGPAVRYYDDCPPAIQKGLETVYFPLGWLANNTPLGEPLEWYVELWQP